jgi:hypothetical protein
MMQLMANTDQEAFDMAVTRFYDGRGAAVNRTEDGITECRYRADNGNTCAIGCMIEPDTYRDWFEGNGLEKLVKDHSLAIGHVSLKLLHDLQWWHDNYGHWRNNYPNASGVASLHHIAGEYNLDDSIIERLRGW